MTFKRIIRENLINIILPQLIILGSLLAAIFMLQGLPEFNSVACENGKDLKSAYERGVANINVPIDMLSFAGFKYSVDGKESGKYYFYMSEDKVYLFLVKNESNLYEKIRGRDREKGTGGRVNLRVDNDKNTVDYILHSYADSMKRNASEMESFFCPVIFNEYKYPAMAIIIVKAFKYICMLLLLILFLYGLLAYIFPRLSIQARDVYEIGKIRGKKGREIYDELEDESLNKAKFYSNGFLVTANYAVSISLSKIKIIYLDNLKNTIVSNVIVKKFPNRRIKKYRLTGTDEKRFYFQHDFDEYEEAEDAAYYIKYDDKEDLSEIEEEKEIEEIDEIEEIEEEERLNGKN